MPSLSRSFSSTGSSRLTGNKAWDSACRSAGIWRAQWAAISQSRVSSGRDRPLRSSCRYLGTRQQLLPPMVSPGTNTWRQKPDLHPARVRLWQFGLDRHRHVQRVYRVCLVDEQKGIVTTRDDRRNVVAPSLGTRIIDDANRAVIGRLLEIRNAAVVAAVEHEQPVAGERSMRQILPAFGMGNGHLH